MDVQGGDEFSCSVDGDCRTGAEGKATSGSSDLATSCKGCGLVWTCSACKSGSQEKQRTFCHSTVQYSNHLAETLLDRCRTGWVAQWSNHVRGLCRDAERSWQVAEDQAGHLGRAQCCDIGKWRHMFASRDTYCPGPKPPRTWQASVALVSVDLAECLWWECSGKVEGRQSGRRRCRHTGVSSQQHKSRGE